MNIEVGMTIKHKWYDMQNDFRWVAIVESIDEENNELKVSIVNDHGSFPEVWNLAHTRSGFNMGEYKRMVT